MVETDGMGESHSYYPGEAIHFTVNFTFHVSQRQDFFSTLIFWQCWGFYLTLLEVFPAPHRCLFNVSGASADNIKSEWIFTLLLKHYPFSTSSAPIDSFKWQVYHLNFSLHCAFSHSRTRIWLMFFLPLPFHSPQTVDVFFTSFPWQTFKVLFGQVWVTSWKSSRSFPCPPKRVGARLGEYCRVLLWCWQSCYQQYQWAEELAGKSVNIRKPQILLPCCEKAKLYFFQCSSECWFRAGFPNLWSTDSAGVTDL